MTSFDNAISLEEQPQYEDNPGFQNLIDEVSEELFLISNNLSSLNTNLLKFQTKLDNHSQASKEHTDVVKSCDKLMGHFRKVQPLNLQLEKFPNSELNAPQRFAKDKMMKSLDESLKKFNFYQKTLADLDRRLNQVEEEQMGTHQESMLQEQVVIEHEPINAEELDYQRNLIQERESEIEHIAEGINELNELFRDLGTFVSQQGQVLDNIEQNIYSVADDTRGANLELRKADRYSRRSRGRCFWVLVILVIFLVFVLLIILL